MLNHRFRYILFGLLAIGMISCLTAAIWFGWVSRWGGWAFKPSMAVVASNYLDDSKEKKNAVPSPGGLIEHLTNPQHNNSGIIITPVTKVVRECRYNLCGHIEVGVPINDPALIGLGISQLTDLYTARDGWEVILAGPERVTLRLTLEQLCPQCAVRRHLGVVDGKVAIFYGPAGHRGGLERLTNLSLSDLPVEWQEPIRLGMLEFEDAESLAQALDNLDEYR
ncbi:MAG: BofC C-terminal domain-containing protein [Bacillota bacterium]|jgi:hypothetical protein